MSLHRSPVTGVASDQHGHRSAHHPSLRLLEVIRTVQPTPRMRWVTLGGQLDELRAAFALPVEAGS